MRTTLAVAAVVGTTLHLMGTEETLAQEITSPDGFWSATLDPTGFAQITNLRTDSAGTPVDHLFETLWYEVSSESGGVTARVETIYTQNSSSSDMNSASFSATGGNLQLDGTVIMVDGEDGGAFWGLTYTNIGTETETVGLVAYFDLDVAQSAGGDGAIWNSTLRAVEQTEGDFTIVCAMFGGGSYEIDTFAALRNRLDGGVMVLTNTGDNPGPADLTCALSPPPPGCVLEPGESCSFSFSAGGSAPCPCDWDANGILNSDDFFAFLNDFLVNGDADFNGDGLTNSDDFFDFIMCFVNAGPPCI